MELLELLGMFHLSWSRVLLLCGLLYLLLVIFKFSALWDERKIIHQITKVFPGPKGHWLLGNALEFKLDGKDFDLIMKWADRYPKAFPLTFGPFVSFLVLHHPDYVKTLMSSTEPKDDIAYRFIVPWIGNGLLVSSGQRWFRHRRLLTPGFHLEILKPYVKYMSDTTITMLDKWTSYADTNESFELFEQVSLMTLDSIMKCAFSYDSDCQNRSGTNEYINAVYELTTLVNRRIRIFPYHNDFIFSLTPSGRRFKQMCQIAQSHTEEVVKKRKEALKEEKETGHKKSKRTLDFLDILLAARDESQNGLSDEDIRAEVDTFMFEGHDTTASGISFILYCLACHPEHQKKCREEINEVLCDKDTMEWSDLSKLPYTTMCIKEGLRLYPPIPTVVRQITKPMTFSDGKSVPAGSKVSASVFAIHRNSTIWENPNVFDPLRFLPENVSLRSPHAFVPFSAGSRNCIGQNFAMNEMKVAVALTLKRYHLMEDPARKPKLIPQMVLRAKHGIHIKIRPVDS